MHEKTKKAYSTISRYQPHIVGKFFDPFSLFCLRFESFLQPAPCLPFYDCAPIGDGY